ncbi:hypothetical protein RvY_02369-2 [Ramazzottius varieornatus]|uniref:Uncharacterized protein n=1 Tax=Ramazzottius varieornatus TaxID=947166 RepID=A0A1D1UJH7_RAMVA|nr:hypothetical protein RvY_02369-2 [Ramazzottius varieornatus]
MVYRNVSVFFFNFKTLPCLPCLASESQRLPAVDYLTWYPYDYLAGCRTIKLDHGGLASCPGGEHALTGRRDASGSSQRLLPATTACLSQVSWTCWNGSSMSSMGSIYIRRYRDGEALLTEKSIWSSSSRLTTISLFRTCPNPPLLRREYYRSTIPP